MLSGGRLSAPTVATTRGEVWVVRDGTSVVRVQAGGSPQAVATPTLQSLGPAQAFQLSPDGTRAALVVEGPSGPGLYIGTVVRADDGSVAVRDFRAIAPELTRVTDVAWRDSGSLLVLAGDLAEGRVVPYSVGVDGWGLAEISQSGLPSEPRSVAAAPTRQPLVDAGGTIWQLTGGPGPRWSEDASPFPGWRPSTRSDDDRRPQEKDHRKDPVLLTTRGLAASLRTEPFELTGPR
ncbi:LpqB family beta-propeller domain-containing protein [Blastococcus brunescens]|uniref:LpqB family beta-propeller domain-containing protein n=1 Tax=Blastococcus brunescens TaxID=1564165 RepID=A0ABZ1AWD9_9ACTN|nr:LpqB family beta-propeller domain-containing protein [Blastococcus sp. BMG 8361]WRL62880.1 LpqB family beta-propeller domain-containing protein [Blastococcus sp. BMG 8361]